MPVTSQPTTDRSTNQLIDLRDPWLAAFLAWLVPGLGHFYQRRWGKGGLFFTCILATFFYGLWLGGGRVVYASFRDADAHLTTLTCVKSLRVYRRCRRLSSRCAPERFLPRRRYGMG